MKKTLNLTLCVLCALMAIHCGSEDGSDCELSGDIPEDTVLSADCPVYTVTSSITVAQDTRLTLDPGVTLVFAAGTQLDAYGDLRARGTQAAPITLTGQQKEKGHWRGLGLMDGHHSLDYVTIEYAGTGITSTSYVTVTNCSIQDNAEEGFSFTGSSRIVDFAGNAVTRNRIAGHISAELMGWLEGSNTFTGNEEDFVVIDRIQNFITDPVNVQAIDVPYLIDELEVRGILNIAAGTRLAFEENGSLKVLGATGMGVLHANGTEENPIVFTGKQETSGSWQGIGFMDNMADNTMDHVVVEYGGGEPMFASDDKANVVVDNSKLTITHATIRSSAGFGIYNHQGTVSLDGVAYGDNSSEDYHEE